MTTRPARAPSGSRRTVAAALRSLGDRGPVATVNAGWEEREADDDELDAAARRARAQPAPVPPAGRRRSQATSSSPPTRSPPRPARRAAGLLRHPAAARHATPCYAVRAPHVAARRSAERRGGRASRRVRDVDAWYARPSSRELVDEIDATARAATERAAHRLAPRRGRAMLDDVRRRWSSPAATSALLLRTLRLFAVAAAGRAAGHRVVGGRDGADGRGGALPRLRAARHRARPRCYDRGLGRVPGIVALPHARRRLDLDDRERMAVLARRFADHRLVLLDDGAGRALRPATAPTVPTANAPARRRRAAFRRWRAA